MDLRSAFGLAVRAARVRLGISQHQLAERADVDHTYVSGLERGLRNPTLLTQDKIATALGVSLARLISDAQRRRAKGPSGSDATEATVARATVPRP